jgi:uncharacterized membrane protein
MGLLVWILMTVVVLSIIGQGWNVFVSSIFKGVDKLLNGISPIAKDLDKQVKQYAATNNITSRISTDVEKKRNNVQSSNV